MIHNIDEELAEDIARWCHESVPGQHDHGYTIEALVDGQHVFVRSQDQVAAQSCGCLQDIFLSALVQELAECGRLDLSEYVGAYLPELNVGTAPGRSIRVADLLCQAAGQRPPQLDLAAAVFATWGNFTDYLTSQSGRFPPGAVVDHGFIERIILVRILTQILQDDPYSVILRRSFVGLNATARQSDIVGLFDLYTYPTDLLKAVERLLISAPEFLRAASAMPRLGSAWIFSPDRVTKGFVPVATSFGLLGFGSGYWGQNGVSADGYLGVRFDESRKSVVVGFAPSMRLRDLVLGQICHHLSLSSGCDPKSAIVGQLNGYSPDDLTGAYDCGVYGIVEVEYSGTVLSLDFVERGGKVPCRVLPDGYLRAAFSWPTLWIEPFEHPSLGTTCIRIGPAPGVRLDSDQ